MITAALVAGSSMMIASIFSYQSPKHTLDLEMQKIFRARGWVTDAERIWKLDKAVLRDGYATLWYQIPVGICMADLLSTEKQYVNLPGILSETFDCIANTEREGNLLKISLDARFVGRFV